MLSSLFNLLSNLNYFKLKTIFKANIASIVASFFDYLLTILLVQLVASDKLLAGVAGTFCGGLVNFLINRHWVFKTSDASFTQQGKKYFIIWVGNLALNALGLYCLISLIGFQYIFAKVTISLFVAIFYNYSLQKRYVFKLSD